MNKSIVRVFFLFIAGGVFICFLVKKLEPRGPIITCSEEGKFLNTAKTFSFKVEDRESGLKYIRAAIVQNSSQKEIYSQEYGGNRLLGKGHHHMKTFELAIDPIKMKLKEGALTLEIEAKDYSWRNKFSGNISIFKRTFIIDRTPPTVSSISTQHYINKGGTGLIVYQTVDSVKSGVFVEKIFFPGFKASSTSDSTYLAYFAVPFDALEPNIHLYAVDEAGNESTANFYYSIKRKNFRTDSLRISENFLQRKIPQFFLKDDTLRQMPLVDAFLEINSKMRAENNRTIRRICSQSQPEKLWEGRFIRLSNSKSSSLFADQRSYFYKGRKIDRQTHLGVDLASIAHAQVKAANKGIIVFQEELGIYGKTIIIDHGQNIFSMYSHLSSFHSSPGQIVKKGDLIGATGVTGLAGGDHLHFSMLVSGVFVNPLEWWDKHWIKDNIILKISMIDS